MNPTPGTPATFDVPSQPCPECGAVLDAATAAIDGQEGGPAPGSVTICFGCMACLELDGGDDA